MKTYLLLLISLSFIMTSNGQNLVVNPSFEDLDTTKLLCDYYQSAKSFNSALKNTWVNPSSGGTSDVITLKVKPSCFTYAYPNKDPLNQLGEQLPHTGKSMAGVINTHLNSLWEYIQNKFVSPLVAGQKYHVSLYISLSDLSYWSSNIGLYFSANPLFIDPGYEGEYPLSFTPQIEFDTIKVDTKNWVKLESDFVAAGSWQYLTIGNFRTNKTRTIIINKETVNLDFHFPGAYYYIDDVSVEVVCTKRKEPSTNICYSNPIKLTAPVAKLRGWADSLNPGQVISNESVLIVKPLIPTTYYLYYNTCDTLVYHINVLGSLSLNLGLDHGIYQGETITLDASNINASYQWQDNSKQSTYAVSQAGYYWVTVTDDYGCKKTDSVYIESIYLTMPNVFTPTGDAVNDHFVPMTMSGIKSAELSIYNRWGALVYKTSDLKQGWDGGDANEGIYYWSIKYMDFNGVNSSQKGELTLIR